MNIVFSVKVRKFNEDNSVSQEEFIFSSKKNVSIYINETLDVAIYNYTGLTKEELELEDIEFDFPQDEFDMEELPYIESCLNIKGNKVCEIVLEAFVVDEYMDSYNIVCPTFIRTKEEEIYEADKI